MPEYSQEPNYNLDYGNEVMQEDRDPLIEHFQNVDLNAVDAAY